MSDRKLAHIEKVIALDPIPGADKIEVCTVLGWKCVVKKDTVKVGDLCCYIEIDSIVPDIPYFEFMKERHFRVRTIKLRKQISQGLVIPLEVLKEDNIKGHNIGEYYMLDTLRMHSTASQWVKEGDDVTEYLGLKKYLSPSEREESYEGTPRKKHNWLIKFLTRFNWYRKLTRTKSKSFPDFISKTDEERIQNIPQVLTQFRDEKCYATEKLDGQSATYWYIHKPFRSEFGICSRTVRKFEFDNSNWSRVAKSHNIKQILKRQDRDLAIQGEIIGPAIQGNKYKLTELKLNIFNIYDIKRKIYFTPFEIIKFCGDNNLTMVPILDLDFKLPETVDKMIEFANTRSTLLDIPREGVVVRTYNKSMSFKAINPVYLLGEEN